jgi:hypothetical protein
MAAARKKRSPEKVSINKCIGRMFLLPTKGRLADQVLADNEKMAASMAAARKERSPEKVYINKCIGRMFLLTTKGRPAEQVLADNEKIRRVSTSLVRMAKLSIPQ